VLGGDFCCALDQWTASKMVADV